DAVSADGGGDDVRVVHQVDVVGVPGFQQVPEREAVVVISGLLIAVRIHGRSLGPNGEGQGSVSQKPESGFPPCMLASKGGPAACTMGGIVTCGQSAYKNIFANAC